MLKPETNTEKIINERFPFLFVKLDEAFKAVKSKSNKIESTSDGAMRRKLNIEAAEAHVIYLSYLSCKCLIGTHLNNMRPYSSSISECLKEFDATLKILEDVYTKLIDVRLPDLFPIHDSLEDIPETRKYALFRKIGLYSDLLEKTADLAKFQNANFLLELRSRFVIVLKNSMDYRNLAQKIDPRNKDFRVHKEFFDILLVEIESIANKYRKAYETDRLVSYMERGVYFLEALKKILFYTQRNDNILTIDRTIKGWKRKLASDRQKR